MSDFDTFHHVHLVWTLAEDTALLRIRRENPNMTWVKVAEQIPYRTAKQCRERWVNHLAPTISKKEWTLEEDLQLIYLAKKFDRHWSAISKNMKGRAPLACRNHFNALQKRLLNTKTKKQETNE